MPFPLILSPLPGRRDWHLSHHNLSGQSNKVPLSPFFSRLNNSSSLTAPHQTCALWLHNSMFFRTKVNYTAADPTHFTLFWPLHCTAACFILLVHLCFYTIYTAGSLCLGHTRIAGEVIFSSLFRSGETHLEYYVHFWIRNTRKTRTYWSESSEGPQSALDHPCARETLLKCNPNEDTATEGKLEILRRLVKKECRHFGKRTTLMDYGQIWHLSCVSTEFVPIQTQDKNATFIFNKHSYIDAVDATVLICTKRSPETEYN